MWVQPGTRCQLSKNYSPVVQHYLLHHKKCEHVPNVWSHKTPGTPKFLVVRPMIDSEKISTKDQRKYQLGVGMLLYLVKHLHPDLANMTRDLSKVNDGANPAAYKELLCVIKYVLDMKNLVQKNQTHIEFQ